MIVHTLRRERIVPVALDFIAQRTDHLRMAEIATLADIDIAPGQLEGSVRPHAVDLLDRALQVEQWCYFNETTDRNNCENSDNEDDRILLEDLMTFPE
ncbi:Uncharacterised protein [Mycobacterium tuberculosis]|nr:Uncharacterised protein [Mycobacterium tuberculosis]